jgi:hypothetical protein
MVAKLTERMQTAQGTEIDSGPGSLAREIATERGANPDLAEKMLPNARDSQNFRADSAFGTRFCEVASPDELDFEQAFSYTASRYEAFTEEQVWAFNCAVAAEGFAGMFGERAIIEWFDWMRNAEGMEDEGVDALTDGDAKLQMKRNSRERGKTGRHHHYDLDEDIILVSWDVVDDNTIRVAFESAEEEYMSYGIVSDGE